MINLHEGMVLVLANLDTGLFFQQGGWTVDPRLAQKFRDLDAVSREAFANHVKNAAAAVIEGDPPHVRGFFWITKPT